MLTGSRPSAGGHRYHHAHQQQLPQVSQQQRGGGGDASEDAIDFDAEDEAVSSSRVPIERPASAPVGLAYVDEDGRLPLPTVVPCREAVACAGPSTGRVGPSDELAVPGLVTRTSQLHTEVRACESAAHTGLGGTPGAPGFGVSGAVAGPAMGASPLLHINVCTARDGVPGATAATTPAACQGVPRKQ